VLGACLNQGAPERQSLQLRCTLRRDKAGGASSGGESSGGESSGGASSGGAKAPTWTAMPARYSATYRKTADILKRAVTPCDEWHIDWTIMGQKTIGLNCETYALVVLDVGSNLGAVINTRTREDPWQHLDELAVIWGHTPKAIHGDCAAEFMHADGFKAWHSKHQIVFNPVEFYLHTMQGHIENLVKQVKTHSRCILKHANLPTRFWSETTTMYMAVRNIMPTDKMSTPFTEAQLHRLHFPSGGRETAAAPPRMPGYSEIPQRPSTRHRYV
jgi:hypothetical protein